MGPLRPRNLEPTPHADATEAPERDLAQLEVVAWLARDLSELDLGVHRGELLEGSLPERLEVRRSAQLVLNSGRSTAHPAPAHPRARAPLLQHAHRHVHEPRPRQDEGEHRRRGPPGRDLEDLRRRQLWLESERLRAPSDGDPRHSVRAVLDGCGEADGLTWIAQPALDIRREGHPRPHREHRVEIAGGRRGSACLEGQGKNGRREAVQCDHGRHRNEIATLRGVGAGTARAGHPWGPAPRRSSSSTLSARTSRRGLAPGRP